MPRNKPRLQLALYSRPQHPGTYHYALLVAPKKDPGLTTKHHVKNTLYIDDSGEAIQPWRYEQTAISEIANERRLLARVIIAKVTSSREHVQQLLEAAPIHQVGDVGREDAETFTCRTWVRDAFQELLRRGAIASRLEKWEDVQREALKYVEQKQDLGRWEATWKGAPGVPLMDLLAGREIAGCE